MKLVLYVLAKVFLKRVCPIIIYSEIRQSKCSVHINQMYSGFIVYTTMPFRYYKYIMQISQRNIFEHVANATITAGKSDRYLFGTR